MNANKQNIMRSYNHITILRHLLAACMGIALVQAVALAGDAMDTEERILELDQVTSVNAKAIEADISIQSHASDTARLLIHRKVKNLSDEDAARVMEVLKTRYAVEGDTLILESDLPKNNKAWKKQTGLKKVNFELRYDLWIPESLDLKLKAVDGDLAVEGITGSCNLSTVDGDILTKNTGSNIVANTVDGDIQIHQAMGTVRTSTVDGDIIVVGATGVLGNTTDGDILVKFTGQPEGNCQLNSIDGDIQVSLPENADVSFTAMSQDGEINCEFPLQSSNGRRGQLNGQINDGGTNLLINCIDGDINITKAKGM